MVEIYMTNIRARFLSIMSTLDLGPEALDIVGLGPDVTAGQVLRVIEIFIGEISRKSADRTTEVGGVEARVRDILEQVAGTRDEGA
jgi:hypothetical protein